MLATRLFWLHCLSPTHAGIGRGLGYIDLPIERDTVTGWPIIRGSGIKGVWADYYGATDDNRRTDPLLRIAFGVSGAESESNAGSLIPSDARLVCLPIRSFRGTFAWATSPLSLSLLRRTLELTGLTDLPPNPSALEDTQAHHTQTSVLIENGRIYLEEFDFQAVSCPTATAWAERIARWVFPQDFAWQEQFRQRFVVLPDTPFDYLCQTCTEVHTRVRIDDGTKTVAEGALWTEEYLPAETILFGIIQCDRIFSKPQENGNSAEEKPTCDSLLDRYANPQKPLLLHIGGKTSVGRGQVRVIFTAVP